MCGRYTIGQPGKIKARFKAKNKMPLFEPSYNVAPSQTLPIITRSSPNRIQMARWGFQFKPEGKGIINIRSETTLEKPYFKKFLTSSRCIIPTDGFYEWGIVKLEGKEEKYPYYFHLEDRKMFGFAGIYNKFEDAEKKPFYTYAILTCPPNRSVKKIHNRMPVILVKDDENKWLDPENIDPKKLSKLMKPYGKNKMKYHIVSKRVNNPKNDGEELIKPYEPLT